LLLNMIKKIIPAFSMAFRAMQGHFFQTSLSILGMIIGVAALVGTLCLIDGMEQYAKEQISQTTSLKSILISSKPTRVENGVVLRKDTFAFITPEKFVELQKAITIKTSYSSLLTTQSTEVVHALSGEKIASVLNGTTAPSFENKVISGRLFSNTDVIEKKNVAVANNGFVKLISQTDSVDAIIGTKLIIIGVEFELVGVVDFKSQSPELFIPITHFSNADLKTHPPVVAIEVQEIDQVVPAKEFISNWLKEEYATKRKDFDVMTNGFRVEQAERGFKLFRVIMGLIVGISVLVGGVGVMNVMLISVTQRTTEIGVRKALGARRQDIMWQFLAESISISAFGSICGLLVGVLGTMATIPIIKAITKVPFQASYTWNTIALVSLIAIVVGVVFGTYPALRASRLDPVEAMRRE
jgi:putative ABC transport system permease protein